MDIEKHVLIAQRKKGIEAKDATPEPKLLYVAPKTTELPDDGVLEYVVVSHVFDLKDVPEYSVVQFDLDLAGGVRLVCENPKLFGVRLVYLSGMPAANYSADFDADTWSLERASYSTVIAETRADIESAKRASALTETEHDRERRAYVRANGNIKAHEHGGVVASSVDVDDDADGEDD